MGSGAYILSRDVNFNREVLEEGGLYFDRDIKDLYNKMSWIYKNQEKRVEGIKFSTAKVKNYYNWKRIAKKYEQLFESIS